MNLNDAIQHVTNEIVTILAENRPTIYLFGSIALDDFQFGWSDIDILVLTERGIHAQQAETLVGLRQDLLERDPGNPYYGSFEGGMLSADAFRNNKSERTVYWGTSGQRITTGYKMNCFDIAVLLDKGILLYGEDIRSKMVYPTYSQMRDDIIDHVQAARTHGDVIGWLLDIARGIFTLRTGKIASKTVAGEWALEEGLCPDADIMHRAVQIRKEPLRYSKDDKRIDNAVVQRFADVLEDELNQPFYYHGTTTPAITELKASPIVYLTSNRAYALFYIIDKSINWVTCGVKEDGAVHYDERFPNQIEKLYSGKCGYLYGCNDTEGFTSGKSRDIVISHASVKVVSCEFIPDIYQEILKYEKTGAIVVNRYEYLTDNEKKDVFDMMVHNIIENDFFSANGGKAKFMKENFPDAWVYAVTHIADKPRIQAEWKKRMETAK